jgi:hypothetical protein
VKRQRRVSRAKRAVGVQRPTLQARLENVRRRAAFPPMRGTRVSEGLGQVCVRLAPSAAVRSGSVFAKVHAVPFGCTWDPPGGLWVALGLDVRSDHLLDVLVSGWPWECRDDLVQGDEAVKACPEVGGLSEGVGLVR